MIMAFAACKSLFIPPLLLYPAPLLQGCTEGEPAGTARVSLQTLVRTPDVWQRQPEAVPVVIVIVAIISEPGQKEDKGEEMSPSLQHTCTRLIPVGRQSRLWSSSHSSFAFIFCFCVDHLEAADRGLARQQVQVQHNSLDDSFGPDNI